MGMLARYLSAFPGGSPFEDRFFTGGNVVYHDPSVWTGPDAPLKVSTVWRAMNVISAGVACLPINAFRRLPRGKEPAVGDPIRMKLRLKPNRIQTSFRWRQHMVGHAFFGGNYYAQLLGMPYGQLQQIWPLDPDRMRVVDVANDGSLTYEYRKKAGGTTPLGQDEILHVRGFSRDGITGISVFELMRDTVSQALMAKKQRTSFLKNEMRPSVVFKHPKELGDTGRENFRKGYKRAYGGPTNAGEAMVLEEGMDISSFQISSRDAQFVESEHFNVEEFLRYTGVPGVLVGYADKTATHASAESFFQSFVTHCIWPITENIEEELTASLYGPDQEDLFVGFNLDALLRADSVARATFYRAMVEMGIYTRNEVRELENKNPIDGLDEPLTPTNMSSGGGSAALPGAPAKRQGPPPIPPEPDDPGSGGDAGDGGHAQARAAALATAAARRVVRKELLAIAGGAGKKGAAERFAADAVGWRRWVRGFYDEHVALVAESLQISAEAARRYCDEQLAALVAGGVAVTASWEESRAAALASLALRGE